MSGREYEPTPLSPPSSQKTATGRGAQTDINETFLSELRECLAERRIERGLSCLRTRAKLVGKLGPAQKNAGCLVGHLAQWIDAGAFDFSFLKLLPDNILNKAMVER